MHFEFRLDKETNINNFRNYFIGYSAGPDSTACTVRLVQSLSNFYRSAKNRKYEKEQVNVKLVFCSSGIERHRRVESKGNALCGLLAAQTGLRVGLHVRREETTLWREADWSKCIREELSSLQENSEDGIILKGHQLDEQVETFVMWSLRGKRNLMKIWDKKNRVARPILCARKREVYSYLERSGFSEFVVEDPTNGIPEANQRAYYRKNVAEHVEYLNPGIYKFVLAETRKQHKDKETHD